MFGDLFPNNTGCFYLMLRFRRSNVLGRFPQTKICVGWSSKLYMFYDVTLCRTFWGRFPIIRPVQTIESIGLSWCVVLCKSFGEFAPIRRRLVKNLFFSSNLLTGEGIYRNLLMGKRPQTMFLCNFF